MTNDILALLESGPESSGILARYLQQPAARVIHTLKTMARAGLVTRVGAAKQWALANQATTNARNMAANEAEEPEVDDMALADAEVGQDDPDVEALEDLAPVVVAPSRKTALRQPHERPKTVTIPSDGSGSWWCQPSAQADRSAFTRARDAEIARMRTSKFSRPSFGSVQEA